MSINITGSVTPLSATNSTLPFITSSSVRSTGTIPSAEDEFMQLSNTVSLLNQDFIRTSIQFDIHDDSGRIVTRIIDRDTGDVIRQIPNEEVLDIARRAAQLQGRLLDATA